MCTTHFPCLCTCRLHSLSQRTHSCLLLRPFDNTHVHCRRTAQVEEAYRSAEGLCKLLGLEAGPVLRFEVPLLQGLQFDLVVHSPYRALAGLFKVCGENTVWLCH
jgi:hypothetical protein